MRTARPSLLVAFALAALGCGVGCASLLGADFDRPGASGDDAGPAGSGVPTPDDNAATDGGTRVDASLPCDGGPCPGTWSAQGREDFLQYAMQIWGSGPKDVCVITEGGFSDYWCSDGDGVWGPYMLGDPGPPGIRALWGSGPNNRYFAGSDGAMIHLNDAVGFQYEDAGAMAKFALWGSGPNDVYTGGWSASILHSTGDGAWTLQTSGALSTTKIEAIWGSGPNDVYAIGELDVFHSAGDGRWTKVFTAPAHINGVWGGDKDDVYVVGEQGGIHHRGADGKWSPQSSPTPSTAFSAVWGSARGDVYIGGQNGVILHGIGDGNWTVDVDQVNEDVVSIWGASSADVYAVTSRNPDRLGSVLHRKPPP
jgi:hypothetical protein